MIEEVVLDIPNEDLWDELAIKLARMIKGNGINIHLEGELGAGKTTFTRALLRALGHKGKVKSPTYTLIENYTIDNQKIYHLDLYRVKNTSELKFILPEENEINTSIYICEWPKAGYPLLPEADLNCYIIFICPGRKILLRALTDRGKRVLNGI